MVPLQTIGVFRSCGTFSTMTPPNGFAIPKFRPGEADTSGAPVTLPEVLRLRAGERGSEMRRNLREHQWMLPGGNRGASVAVNVDVAGRGTEKAKSLKSKPTVSQPVFAVF
jgi:hypothetical protein